MAVAETPSAMLAAHSLGCALVAHWSRVTQHSVRGALLVAPADVERPEASEAVRGFAPIPMERLPFPSIVVASRTDPHVTLARARHFAAAWGSRLVEIGDAGHIADSFGGWPEGLALIEELAR